MSVSYGPEEGAEDGHDGDFEGEELAQVRLRVVRVSLLGLLGLCSVIRVVKKRYDQMLSVCTTKLLCTKDYL